MKNQAPMKIVIHFVDAMMHGSTTYLWGQEKVVQQRMHDQRSNGITPHLITFRACHLAALVASEG